jgi:hypothetical protein
MATRAINLLLISVVIIILISGCSSQKYVLNNLEKSSQNSLQKESIQKPAQKEVTTAINSKELFKNLESIKSSKDTSYITNVLEETYYYINQINTQIFEELTKLSSSEVSKEYFCNETNEYNNELSNLSETFPTINFGSDVILSDSLSSLKGSIHNKNNLIYRTFSHCKTYCSEDSILAQSKCLSSVDSFKKYKLDFESRDEKVEIDPFSGGGYSTYDQSIYSTLNNIKEKLPSLGTITNTKMYGIGDSIEKGGLKVTLNSVNKRYIGWESSYSRKRYDWTDQEWKQIQDYQFQIAGTSDKELKQKLIAELNSTFGNRIKDESKFWFFDVNLELLDKTNQKAQDYYNKFYYQRSEVMSLYDIESENVFNEYECLSNLNWEGRGLFQREDSKTKIKLIISFDNCGGTKADIEAIEKGQMCDNTYIFNVDLDKI